MVNSNQRKKKKRPTLSGKDHSK